MPAAVREQNHNRRLTVLKKKMAKLGSVKNKKEREALLQEANALVALLGDAAKKKNKKTEIQEEEDEEAGLAELPVDTHAQSASPNPKPKKKKTAQNDELDRTLATCTVQCFAGCPVPSNFSL